ncbi:hypothetical protein GCM10007862_29810 [Dyella lipolytica]|uniref:Uncharacterized protein n=1 Tax=Dyella lipolytica TaxID=1867835 RepID=A0ABW8IX17_9GAMM|nr:hypothetical protein [Dyella lipolytica]GLQ47930.1 hypothetical protein GCM10007862_29810 [Dyella lipolytica]
MLLTPEEIELRLAELSRSMPRLLKDNHGTEFWIEFMERADAIKDRVSLDHFDWVTERIYEVLVNYGISPPSRWILGPLSNIR